VASKLLSLRYPRLWLVLGWMFVGLALLACLAPAGAPGLGGLFALNDKVEHALGYMALTVWFTGMYSRSRYVWIALALFAMGVMVELLQGWMSLGRNRDPLDVVANTTGIVIGLSLALTVLGGWAQRVEDRLAKREH
jgi:VanZ family protein